MILVVLLWAVSFAASLIGVEMTINPPTDKGKKWYRIAFICLGILGICLAIPQYLEQEKKDAADAQTLGEIKTNTAKPSFQLFLNSFMDTKVADRFETNLLKRTVNHIFEISRAPSEDGISSGEIIHLKKSKDISLSVIVYGDSPADHLTVELTTPWVDQVNITGDIGWQDLGEEDFLDSSTKTFAHAHSMLLEMNKPIPPNQFIPLPKLQIPTNYPSASLPIRFKIYSNNAKFQEVGVIFNLE
jgi:hypothetical protein